MSTLSDNGGPAPTSHEAEIHAYTFRRGMLARLGHDLRLSLGRFTLELATARISARLDLGSFTVDGALNDGVLSRTTPSPSDRREIEATIARDIFDTRNHPEATFAGSLSELRPGVLRASGTLGLRGVERPMSFDVALGPRARAVLEIAPSQWGIPPYKALGGALKLEDRVKIEIELSTAVPGFELAQWQNARYVWQRS